MRTISGRRILCWRTFDTGYLQPLFIQPWWAILHAYAEWRYFRNRTRHTALKASTILGTASRELLQRDFQRCFIAWNVGASVHPVRDEIPVEKSTKMKSSP